MPIHQQHIRTDPRIYKFLTGHAYRKAAEHLPHDEKVAIIARAIEQQTPLEMAYLKANDSKSSRIIKPITVGEEDWQGKRFIGMRAYCTQLKQEQMFNVARILDLNEVA